MSKVLSCLLFLLLFANVCLADKPVENGNSDPVYRQLRDIGVGSEGVTVTNFVLKRDAATFTFTQGTFSFLAPVNGKVTGAIFNGQGTFNLAPPLPFEQRVLSYLTKSNETSMTETFTRVVLRFTDNTYEELKKAGTPMQGAVPGAFEALRESQENARKRIQTNYDARILQDVLSSDPGGFFLAFINGQKYSGKMLLCIDPHGCEGVQPEEISLMIYDDMKFGIYTAFHYSGEYANGTANGTQENTTFNIEAQNLDTVIERNASLKGNALATVVSRVNDLRALNFSLFSRLRVQQVTDAAGSPLQFIQEDKDRDFDYWVILPKGLTKGEKFQVRTKYEGKDAIRNEGGGNYYPVARSTWYPNASTDEFSMYELKFSTPKKIQVVATGTLVSEGIQGDQNVTIFKSDIPLTVAGFNLGEYKKVEVKLQKSNYLVESYANKNSPDVITAIRHVAEGTDDISVNHQDSGLALGTMDMGTLMKKPLAEAQLSMALYDSYFGSIPHKRVSMTPQTACSYGQSWPNLVYLPMCSFFDGTVRHQLGLDDTRGYWKTVAAHEVAHQWWGHTVAWNSYRDQWMSEGFSEFAASLFIQVIQKNNGEFLKFWKDQLDLLTEKNKEGFRAIDVGPLTLGYRASTARTGGIYSRLVYPKGAFVLHMVRMMMWDPQKRDGEFQAMMHDFVQTYQNKAASTEDFKAMLEKHMTLGRHESRRQRQDGLVL
ncbi:MAG TPA: M1 family aminopeptidase [Terriglobales bacterium]|nr:M1 family aminopeptidase [Terriglobales bacterium]